MAIEVSALQPVLGSRGAHTDHLLPAQAGSDEGQSAYPGGQRAPGLKKVFARLHVLFEGITDAHHKHEVEQNDQPINWGEVQLEKLLGVTY